MPDTLQVAAIQLDNQLLATQERLLHAEALIAQAAANGAQLIVLPAAFNTGKTFAETNYERTEYHPDMTQQWLCQQASEHDVHLAAAMMMVEQDDTYHTAWLIAPDGRTWNYKQVHPKLWERAFYRNGTGITVAHTDIGNIGLMVGWDAAHPDIWERYAAKVDLLLVLHAELDSTEAYLCYRDGSIIETDQLGYLARWLTRDSADYLATDLAQQGEWLNVPLICAGLSGSVDSILPAPYFSIQALLVGRPELLHRAADQYAEMRLIAPMMQQTHIQDQYGHIISVVEGDAAGIAQAQITLPDAFRLPLDQPQPPMQISSWQRIIIDFISDGLLTLTYRRGVRRQWGARMAPVDWQTRIWLGVVLIVAILAAIFGRLLSSPRR